MIKKIKFYLMVLADYLLLASKTTAILGEYNGEDLQLDLVKNKINNALKRLENSMKLRQGSPITEELAVLDANRDQAWMCFYHYIIGQSNRLNPAIRERALSLLSLVKLPEMRIYQQGYKEQTATMINFFNRVDSNPELVAAVEAIGATAIYLELKTAQTAFSAKEAEKVNKGAAKPKSESEEAIKDLRKAFDDLNQFLNVMSQLSGKAEYEEIASKINELADEINTNVKARNTRRENAKEEADQTIEN